MEVEFSLYLKSRTFQSTSDLDRKGLVRVKPTHPFDFSLLKSSVDKNLMKLSLNFFQYLFDEKKIIKKTETVTSTS